MIIWISRTATGYPNDQRAEILRINGKELIVLMLSTGDPKRITANDIVGVELSDDLAIKFRVCDTMVKS